MSYRELTPIGVYSFLRWLGPLYPQRLSLVRCDVLAHSRMLTILEGVGHFLILSDIHTLDTQDCLHGEQI